MSFILTWISSLFTSTETKTITKTITETENEELVILESGMVKWQPDDELYRKYNKYTLEMALASKDANNLKTLENRAEYLKTDMERLQNSDNVMDIVQINEIKVELMSLETKIKKCYLQIEKLNQPPDDIITKYMLYTESARNFLIKHNMVDIEPEHILTSNSIYILLKKNIDGYIVSINNESYYDMILKIDTLFDIKQIKDKHDMNIFKTKEFNIKKIKLLKEINEKETIDHIIIDTNFEQLNEYMNDPKIQLIKNNEKETIDHIIIDTNCEPQNGYMNDLKIQLIEYK